MQKEEIHPWKVYAPLDSTILIVGTFPTALKNRSFDFFYPNKANLFWNVMSKINLTDLHHFSGSEAVEERKQILQSLKIAITDMGLKVIRNDDSSLDENLFAIEYTDIFEILNDNPKINKILFTSSSGKVSAVKWFIEYLAKQSIIHKFPKGPKPIKSIIQCKKRIIECVILFSPSRRAANRIGLDKLVNLYKNEILISNTDYKD